jgi:uncharacterized protein YkwD
VIRFACPGCKIVLSGRDQQAGKIVTCPQCGQRMKAPRPAKQTARGKEKKASSRPRIAGIALVGMLLLAGAGGGMWLWTNAFNREPEPSISEHPHQAPPPSSRPDRETPVVVETKKPAARVSEPTAPHRDAGGSEELPPPDDAPDSATVETKQIDLAEDLPPELPFDLVDAINAHRAKAGVEPIFLDAKASRKCQSRAEQLARHAAKLDDEAMPKEGRKEDVATEAPLAAIERWLKEPERRAGILEPRLRTFAAGFARNVQGQWVSVFNWTHGINRESPMETPPVMGAVVYPAPGQRRVPLWFPGNETPDPLPQTKDKLAGYPITLIFPPQARIEKEVVHLSNKEEGDIAVWLSTPKEPANPQFAALQQNTICLIAKKPLRPSTRYLVEASALVNGAAWSAKWDFRTVSAGEIYHEKAGAFVRMLNGLRRRAGLSPVALDAARSKGCAAHALYLAQNALVTPAFNWNQEKTDLPGYTAEGASVAPTAAIQGGGGPVEAVAGLIDSIISRPQLLDPRLRRLGLGYTPFASGGWIWVVDLRCEPRPVSDREYFYPAPDQESVPLVYPPHEVPSPVPARSPAERGNEGEQAGYAVTVLFGPTVRVTAAAAKLVDDKGIDVDGWFSTPERPAIAGFPQQMLCLLPKTTLKPDTRYTVTFQAEVNGRPWRRTWGFTTLKELDRYADDLDDKILVQVNAVRKEAGLSPVRLDAALSRGCQAHARYLALNHPRSSALSMSVHRQNADLPGASPEGAKAAKGSDIAVVLDPQNCVENWMATLYHRLPILTPNLERIGFGHARVHGPKWVCVLDVVNGRASSQ